jgi:hypothetical protein
MKLNVLNIQNKDVLRSGVYYAIIKGFVLNKMSSFKGYNP